MAWQVWTVMESSRELAQAPGRGVSSQGEPQTWMNRKSLQVAHPIARREGRPWRRPHEAIGRERPQPLPAEPARYTDTRRRIDHHGRDQVRRVQA